MLKEKPGDSTQNGLPSPKGSLSTTIPSSAIESANELVCGAKKVQTIKHKTGESYHKLTPDMRARISRYACENCITAAATRNFLCASELGKPLNESTVQGIKTAYLSELGQKK